MDAGTTLYLPHLPNYPIHISLFQNVQNADFLREQLVQANAEFEYAFIDAAAVCFWVQSEFTCLEMTLPLEVQRPGPNRGAVTRETQASMDVYRALPEYLLCVQLGNANQARLDCLKQLLSVEVG
jgi:Kinase binding protein CGI-121